MVPKMALGADGLGHHLDHHWPVVTSGHDYCGRDESGLTGLMEGGCFDSRILRDHPLPALRYGQHVRRR